MFEVDPIWQMLPRWAILLGLSMLAVILLGLSMLAVILGGRFDRRTDAFLERLDEREAPIETKAYLVHVESYKTLRSIQAFTTLIAALVGYAVLFGD